MLCYYAFDHARIGEPMVVKFCLLLCYFASDYACTSEPNAELLFCFSKLESSTLSLTEHFRNGSDVFLSDDGFFDY